MSTARKTVVNTTSYASQKNARFKNSASHYVDLNSRFTERYNSLTPTEQRVFNSRLSFGVGEFTRKYSNISKWSDLHLAEAKEALLSDIYIDTTMQRTLNLRWIATLLSKFNATRVVPIQVYREPITNKLMAWDGQHTSILLWYIVTKILNLDPSKIKVPVNIYHSSLKSEMRENFVSLNSEDGKLSLDDLDIFEQQVYGVRIDNSTNPTWILSEKKQAIIEKYDLFLTHEKFGDTHMPNAISRMPEVNRLKLQTLEWLCEYLSLATSGVRSVREKEMVMMAHYFERCAIDKIAVDIVYISDLANTIENLWGCGFAPQEKFWTCASIAYYAWHHANVVGVNPRFSSELVHGFPFLIAQLNKSFNHAVPMNDSNSGFWPANEHLA